jgi:DNA-binding NtrC family response regulator
VLVVDDESLVRWSVAETLGAKGYEVSEAADGASAIRAFSGSAPGAAAVILDLRLPDCADLRVLEAIRRLSPTTSVILMTAYDTPEVREEALRLGAFTVVRKPIEMDDVAPLVERALTARPH